MVHINSQDILKDVSSRMLDCRIVEGKCNHNSSRISICVGFHVPLSEINVEENYRSCRLKYFHSKLFLLSKTITPKLLFVFVGIIGLSRRVLGDSYQQLFGDLREI